MPKYFIYITFLTAERVACVCWLVASCVCVLFPVNDIDGTTPLTGASDLYGGIPSLKLEI